MSQLCRTISEASLHLAACAQALANLSVRPAGATACFTIGCAHVWPTLARLPVPAAHEAVLQALYNCCRHEPARAAQVRLRIFRLWLQCVLCWQVHEQVDALNISGQQTLCMDLNVLRSMQSRRCAILL
jgi:hypothetical protein